MDPSAESRSMSNGGRSTYVILCSMLKRVLIVICFCSGLSGVAAAETVSVKYRGEVPLDTFECEDISRSSFIEHVCYDADNEYMVIGLSGTCYDYCEIDADTVGGFLSASSMGAYYNLNIKGNGEDGPFDCRTHQAPDYSDQQDQANLENQQTDEDQPE